MTPVLLLVHGWGFDATFWKPLRAALPDMETVAWDLGFTGCPARPALPEGRPVVAVGHSFGFLWLLMEQPVTWRHLVAINGFPRFAQGDDWPAGVPIRVIERMIARFAGAPEAVHADFMTRAGLSATDLAATAGSLDRPRLDEGLKGLRHWDGRGRMAGPVSLALAGRSDVIAPPALSEAGFARSPLAWHEGGHLLPWHAPDWCAGHLRRLCRNEEGVVPVVPDEE